MITSVRNILARLRSDERGLTAVEYAVLGGIVVGVLATAGVTFSGALSDAFEGLVKNIT
jgi:pilus assembly protein Flp/PilA